ncbi:hypothetical protein T08_589 [Trichinella sp. T8]|nr:hypothetical protein T08_589 [Trichinella sp. T8]
MIPKFTIIRLGGPKYYSEITISPSSLVDCIIGFLKGGKVSTFDNPTTTVDAHRTAPFTTLTTSLYRRSPYKKVNVMRRCNFVVVVTLPPSFREVRPELSLRDVIPQRCTPHCSVHHTDDLTLPPVALQKGKRDAQVQFRGRRHTRNKSS